MNDHREMSYPAYAHTCDWIFQHPVYKSWINSQKGLLWIKGTTGSGKSTLLAFMRGNCQDDLVLDFFFYGRGSPLQHSSAGMFRSLLHQLFIQEKSVRSLVKATYKEAGWNFRTRELNDLFRQAIINTAKSRAVTIIVDGLDESGDSEAREIISFFNMLDDHLAFSKDAIKICISSRHYPHLSLTTALEIHMGRESTHGISTYVSGSLRALVIHEEHGWSFEEYDILENEILRKCEGSFLWAHLVVTTVTGLFLKGSTWSRILQIVRQTPPSLLSIYQYTFGQIIGSGHHLEALHLMQWISLAERPLSVTELRYALTSDNTARYRNGIRHVKNDVCMERLATTLCGGLIVAQHHKDSNDNDSKSVQFIHQSVRDFLIQDGLRQLATDYSNEQIIGKSQDRLCRSCIKYLKREEMLRKESMQERDRIWLLLPFIDYASRYWSKHAERAESLGLPQQDLVQQLGYSPDVPFKVLALSHRKIDCYHSDILSSHEQLRVWGIRTSEGEGR
jgi:energy-coupling factor transporter ATP-binding protein EcfA2